jgi:vancomycin resistance protein YoaR
VSASYAGAFFPGLSVAGIPVGGLTPTDARLRVEQAVSAFLEHGLSLEAQGMQAVLPLRSAADQTDLRQDFVRLPVEETLAAAFQYGRHGSFLTQWRERATLWNGQNIPLRYADTSNLSLPQALTELFPAMVIEAVEPSFAVTKQEGAWRVQIQPGKNGRQFNTAQATERITRALRTLDPSPIRLEVRQEKPLLSADDLAPFASQVEPRLNRLSALVLTTSEHGGVRLPIVREELAQAITVSFADKRHPALAWNEAVLRGTLEKAAEAVAVPAQNARFALVGTRVEEFAPSKPGQELDQPATLAALLTAFLSGDTNDEVAMITKTLEPEITNEEVNNLGITTLLGTGVSSYRGSPVNRIKNIAHATEKLNGLLLAPNEVFSALKHLQPLTLEDGYFNEMVIKGDKITPEVAGGLCQIGSTLFRTAMNTGLPILQRQNHSLVVSYYNDARNNQPGTDATLYEPSLDLKFENDTGNYLLLVAENDTEKKELRYSLWGTSDGRYGSYTPPTVERWVPAGETVTHYSTEIPVGTHKCQSKHPGATTSFLYTIARPDGTVTEREFRSYYRPLAEQCTVGVSPEEKALRDAGQWPETQPATIL